MANAPNCLCLQTVAGSVTVDKLIGQLKANICLYWQAVAELLVVDKSIVLILKVTVCLCLQAVAELLTTDKLSELACVTLYMMYEKMNGKKSRWHHYIKELDR